MADFTSGDDRRGLQETKNRVVGEVKAIHAGVKTVVEQPRADILIAQRSIFDAGALGPKLGQIHIDEIGIGHGGPFRLRSANEILCRVATIGQPETLTGPEIYISAN